MKNKPNCYECKYRGEVAGSAHSCCEHPAFNGLKNPFAEIMSIFASVGRVPPVNIKNELKVKGNPYGIKSGWFNHPYNFDPVWLEKCNGFKKQDEK